jgi:hypothetical protein
LHYAIPAGQAVDMDHVVDFYHYSNMEKCYGKNALRSGINAFFQSCRNVTHHKNSYVQPMHFIIYMRFPDNLYRLMLLKREPFSLRTITPRFVFLHFPARARPGMYKY